MLLEVTTRLGCFISDLLFILVHACGGHGTENMFSSTHSSNAEQRVFFTSPCFAILYGVSQLRACKIIYFPTSLLQSITGNHAPTYAGGFIAANNDLTLCQNN